MSRFEKRGALAALAAYMVFVIVFRSQAESALSGIFQFIGDAWSVL